MASLMVDGAAMYFTFVDERATIGCFLLTQLIVVFVNINANLVMDLLEFKFSSQFEYEKTLRVTPSSSPKYCNHRYCIP